MADYSTLTVLKAELHLTDTLDDARISRLITAASRAVDGWCKRPNGGFVGTSETRYFDVPQTLSGAARYTRDATLSQMVSAGTWPSVTIGTIDIDAFLSTPAQATVKTDDQGDGTFPTTWAASDYYFLPLNAGADGYPYRQLRVNLNGTKQLPIGPKVLSIQGTWGYSLVTPPAVEEATILTVIRWFKRPDAPYGVMGSAEMGFVRVPAVDPDVYKILCDAGLVNAWVFA